MTPDEIFQTFRQTVLRLLPERSGGPVIVAVSGGPDSMVLAQLCVEAGMQPILAHAAYGLRGADSNADEALVREWSTARGLPTHIQTFSKEEAAAAGAGNFQAGARKLRYEWMEELRKEERAAAVFTAHHTDDVAETFLLNLLRGAGIRGLRGIAEQRGFLMRPLLWARKDDLLAYSASREVPFRTDRSNEEETYARNRIRLRALPLLEELSPGAALRIVETAARLAETEVLYDAGLARRMKGLIEQRGQDWYLPVRKWVRAQPRATLLLEVLGPFGLLPAQIQAVQNLFDSEGGKQVLTSTHCILRHRDFLVVSQREGAGPEITVFDQVRAEPVLVKGGELRLSKSDIPKTLEVAGAEALLDADAFAPPYTLRTLRPGDYFYPLGMGRKKKKVGRFLSDCRVPRTAREGIYALFSGDRLAWVVGHRIDERFKVTAATRSVVRAEWIPRAS